MKITRRCNLKCLFCQFYKGQEVNKKEELSDNKWIEIVKEACDLGVEKFQVMGLGEALCRKRLTIRIMKKIKKEERVGSLLTNGTLFDEASIRNIVEIGWDEILFSIDGPDAKTHDYLRGVKGTFDRVIKNLELFNKYKKKYKTDLPKIGIATVLTNKNYNKLGELLEMANLYEAETFLLWPLLVITNPAKKLILNANQQKKIREEVKILIQKANELKIITNLHQFLDVNIVRESSSLGKVLMDKIKNEKKNLLKIPCYFPWFYMLILPEGWVHICPMSYVHTENIKNKKLKEIWFGKSFQQIREKLKNGEMLPFCISCCGPTVLENIQIRSEIERMVEKNEIS